MQRSPLEMQDELSRAAASGNISGLLAEEMEEGAIGTVPHVMIRVTANLT